MTSMAVEDEPALQVGSPACCDEIEVAAIIAAVYLIADQRVAQIGGVHANLMHAPRMRAAAQQRHLPAATKHIELGAAILACRVAALAHMNTRLCHILHAQDGFGTAGRFPQRSPLHHGVVFLVQQALLHRFPQF